MLLDVLRQVHNHGHIRGFDWYGGVFPTLVFDNLKTAVKQILRGKGRVEQTRFTAFRAHYTFEARFCNPARGQEKGGVEGLVGFARRNFLVPVPEVTDFEELNAQLLERCATDDQRRIGGRSDDPTIGERHGAERAYLLALPGTRFENTKVVGVRISRYQTAQVDQNRYSVPTAYVGRRLWAHIGCDRVSFYADQKKVAEHARAFGHSDWRIDPLHYLELIRRKVASFESARPIRQWRPRWPAHYETLLERLRDRHGYSRGTREFIGILQLHQDWDLDRVSSAIQEALDAHCIELEAVRHILMREDTPTRSHAPLESGLMPGITDLTIARADLDQYDRLLAGGVR